MNNIFIKTKTYNNCIKIQKKFDLLKITANFKYYPFLKCNTPYNCYLEKMCIIETDKKCISKEGKKYIKNLHERSIIEII